MRRALRSWRTMNVMSNINATAMMVMLRASAMVQWYHPETRANSLECTIEMDSEVFRIQSSGLPAVPE